MSRTKKKQNLKDKLLIGAIIFIASFFGIKHMGSSHYPIKSPFLNKPSKQEVKEKLKPPSNLENLIKKQGSPDFSEDSDVVLLARLIYGEARGGSDELKIAVAYTALNRLGKESWYGKTLKEVILKHSQYSCFNKNDPNLPKLQNPCKFEAPSVWQKCLYIASLVLSRQAKDPTNGATHYHTSKVKPFWSKRQEPVYVIGNTLFYRLEN